MAADRRVISDSCEDIQPLDIESLLRTAGYPALFVGSVLEGETCLVPASLLAREGILDLSAVIAVACTGAVCGD